MYLGFFVQGSHKPPRRKFNGVARLPLDRFVSRDSIKNNNGTLLTPLVRFDPDTEQLQLNAHVAAGGEIRVQLRDEQGRVLPGYSFDECSPIQGDSIRHPVRWQNHKGPLGKTFGGRALKMELLLRRARLFAFYLTSPTWAP